MNVTNLRVQLGERSYDLTVTTGDLAGLGPSPASAAGARGPSSSPMRMSRLTPARCWLLSNLPAFNRF